jgi:hypothetical protein
LYYERIYNAAFYTSVGTEITVPCKQYRVTYDEAGKTIDKITNVLPQPLLNEEQQAAIMLARQRRQMRDMGLLSLAPTTMPRLASGPNGSLWLCATERGVRADYDNRVLSITAAVMLGSIAIASAVYDNQPESYDQSDVNRFVPEAMSEANAYMFMGDNCSWRDVTHAQEPFRVADIQLFHIATGGYYGH